LNTCRKEIKEIKEKFFPSTKREESHGVLTGLKVGEHVRIESLRSHGVVTSVDGSSNQIEVMTHKAKVKTTLSDILQVRDGEEEGEFEIAKDEGLPKGDGQERPSQLNVIGLTVEDAIPKVDKFIDQALLNGVEKIHIVHGIGSGRLRNAIGKYLKGHRGVKQFASGDGMRGGGGITVVELR